MSGPVVIENDALRVTVNPRVGGTITEIRHKPSGLSVLGTVPWDPVDRPLDSEHVRDERTWLTRYTGGWPPLFPNGGDACTFAGRFHGFHGEASISAWDADSDGMTIRLARRFEVLPVSMRREIGLSGDVLTVRETAVAEGPESVTVMWGHHPTFGSDLLDGDFELQSGAREILVDGGYDPPANPLLPGATGRWPMVAGKAAMVDLRRAPRGIVAAMAYLRAFDHAWVSIRRLDGAVAVALSWDAEVFPCAWLWYELGGTPDEPWRGEARLIGLEPNTTCLGAGIAEAARRGERLLTLQPGVPVQATVRLQVFRPAGEVRGVGPDGRAICAL